MWVAVWHYTTDSSRLSQKREIGETASGLWHVAVQPLEVVNGILRSLPCAVESSLFCANGETLLRTGDCAN